MELLQDVVNPTSQDHDTVPASEKAKAELARYVGEHSSELDPLVWWKGDSSRYPVLTQLVQRYLGILATSVPSD